MVRRGRGQAPARPVHRRGGAVRVSAAGTRATRASSRCRGAWPPAEARESAHTPPAPSRGKLQLIRFFAALRSDVFLFCLVLEGRVGSGKANTKPTRRGAGEEGPRGHTAGAQSEAPRASPAPAPGGPRGRPGGQLLYWQALRPEAGPCRPP